ncbi:MAG: TAT-variant-translocated molybdopterin oxidoreductase [Rhodospirillaceae bacterium]
MTPHGPLADMVRARLRGRTGRRFWRGVEELAETAAFDAFLRAEFPALALPKTAIDRRSLLKVMAASFALAGLTGCEVEPDEAALPYVRSPEFVVPGEPKWYATSVTLAGFARPVLGKTHVGRPVKLEGNPDHPATRGATDAFMQAALLDLYDPARSQSPRLDGRPVAWSAVDAALADRRAALDRSGGEGLRLLTGATSSPTLAGQMVALAARWPAARWHVHEPLDDDAGRAAIARVFGRPLEPHLVLEDADVVVCLDADPLGTGPRQPVHARRWSERRAAMRGGDGHSRLFVAEPTPTITGAIAEDRLPVAPQRIGVLVHALARALGVPADGAPTLTAHERQWLESATAALESRPGRALAVVGAAQPSWVHALSLLVNERLGSFGATLRFSEPVLALPPEPTHGLPALAADMHAGRVETLVILDANPLYAAPPDFALAEAMRRVPFRLHAGLHRDETAAACSWHLPLPHELELWSDARAVDGTAGIIQPLVRPFYPVRSQHEVIAGLLGGGESGQHLVRDRWRHDLGGEFDERWIEALRRGFVAGSAPAAVVPTVADRSGDIGAADDRGGLSVAIRPDSTVWDGRFAGNAWLQELPKPLTKVTWGNVILVAPALAAERSLRNGDEVRLDVDGRSVTGAAWILPGQDAQTVTVTLGYGRRQPDGVADGLGYDAYALARDDGIGFRGGAALAVTGARHEIACTQHHQAMDGYDFVRTVASSDLHAADGERPEARGEPPSLYPAHVPDSPSWGMSIDLDACIGCNACVVACVAENNVPVVGKPLVAQGREMHWLRIDRYYEGDPAAPTSYFQPVPCMHCEQAPCEMGCPVNAAVHSRDGLNLQVYNRCIGTRTCSSYCPYKVRRFNWFDYTGGDPEPVRAMRNPDVTVRARGVMEKCTYCIQRISRARIAAKLEDRAIRDGEVVTACQAACPTRAIVFGDVTDPATRVSREKARPRSYSLLEEANTRPRTTYLARIETGRGRGGGGAR